MTGTETRVRTVFDVSALRLLTDSMDKDCYPGSELVRAAANHIEALTALLHANEEAFDEDTNAAVDELDSWVALARRALNMIADFDLNDHDADVAASWIDAYGSLTGERP